MHRARGRRGRGGRRRQRRVMAPPRLVPARAAYTISSARAAGGAGLVGACTGLAHHIGGSAVAIQQTASWPTDATDPRAGRGRSSGALAATVPFRTGGIVRASKLHVGAARCSTRTWLIDALADELACPTRPLCPAATWGRQVAVWIDRFQYRCGIGLAAACQWYRRSLCLLRWCLLRVGPRRLRDHPAGQHEAQHCSQCGHPVFGLHAASLHRLPRKGNRQSHRVPGKNCRFGRAPTSDKVPRCLRPPLRLLLRRPPVLLMSMVPTVIMIMGMTPSIPTCCSSSSRCFGQSPRSAATIRVRVAVARSTKSVTADCP
jgi:hypothetical protein